MEGAVDVIKSLAEVVAGEMDVAVGFAEGVFDFLVFFWVENAIGAFGVIVFAPVLDDDFGRDHFVAIEDVAWEEFFEFTPKGFRFHAANFGGVGADGINAKGKFLGGLALGGDPNQV